MLEMVADGGLWSLVPIVLCVVGYSRFAHKLSTVAVPEEEAGTELESGGGGGEKTALLHPDEVERGTDDVLRKSLVRWAVGVLPINAAVCYLVCFHWVAAADGTMALWHYILLSYFAIGPVLGALCVLLYTFVLTHTNLRPSAETYHTLRRTSMLDGVVLPPGLVIGAVCTFPNVFAPPEGEWVGYLWLGAAVYVVQAVVWMRCFWVSRCASVGSAGARVGV